GALPNACQIQERRRLSPRQLDRQTKGTQGQNEQGGWATGGGIAGLVMGCLVGPMGRRFLSSKTVFRTRGALPNACQIQERRRLSPRQLDRQTKGTQGQNERGASATVGGIAGLVMGCLVGPMGRRFL